MKIIESEKDLSSSNDKNLQDEKALLKIDDRKPCDSYLPTNPSRSKPNSVPASLLILAFILANIEVSKGLTCSSSLDIRWISKKTNNLVGCTPCTPCPPSQEYSIPCGSQAYVGTPAKCIPCPQGKYSDGFDYKSCVSCTLCSGKIVKRKCSLSRNSICGDCLPGFYYQPVSFSCMKCGKCCHDGQDEAHSSCAALNLCKSRPNGCPLNRTTIATNGLPVTVTTPTDKSSVAIIKEIASTTLGLLNNNTPQSVTATPETTKPRISLNKRLSLDYMTTLSPDRHKLKLVDNKEEQTTSESPLIIAVLVILSVVAIVLIIGLIIFITGRHIKCFKALHKPRKTHDDNPSDKVEAQYIPVRLQEAGPSLDIPMTEMVNSDQTFESFLQKNYLEVDKLCKVLCIKKLGKWDFERVANVWKLEKDDVLCLRKEVHTDQGSPVRTLLEMLCSQRLCSTVRELAVSLKSINKDAYEILEPHFLEPTETREGTDN